MKTQNAVKAAAVLAAAFLAGCAHNKQLKTDNSTQTKPAAAQAAQISAISPVETGEPTMRDASVRSIPELQTVYFDYNSDFLQPSVGAVLKSNAEWLKAHQDIKVQVQGNCDQRGTEEYNLALGQRRAASVRKYYIHMGVSGTRVATISYGKEHPACSEATEDCYKKNRRGETLEALTQNVSSSAVPPAAAQ
jgi:peptidoglycan-associated lipoprotein